MANRPKASKPYGDILDYVRWRGDLSFTESPLRLQLFAEEMLNLVRTVTGDMKASFWIERDGNRFDLLLLTNTVMNKKKRELLIASSSSISVRMQRENFAPVLNQAGLYFPPDSSPPVSAYSTGHRLPERGRKNGQT